MTTNPEAPIWGAQQSPDPVDAENAPKSRWNNRRTGAAIAVALALTTAAGGAVHAAAGTDSANTDSSATTSQTGMQPPGEAQGPFGTAAHGSFQQGEVTEISSSSVSVRSGDGYTKTYTIPSDVVRSTQDVQTGDTVTVVSEDGSAATSIVEAGGQPSAN